MNQELTGALSGLRRLELADLNIYKNAINQTARMCWQQYFPFLYFYYVVNGNDNLLISEVDGSVCIFLLKRDEGGKPKLFLYFLPMPMNERVLKACLERVRDFNNARRAVIYWVDEEEIGVFEKLEGSARAILINDREYIYDPKIYHSLSGKGTRNLRRNLDKIFTRDDVEVRAFEERDIEDCLGLMDEWAVIQQDKYEQIAYQRYTHNCVKSSGHFDKNELFGKVVLVGGKIRSFGFAGEIRAGLANLFISYSDHNIKGLNQFLTYRLMLDMESYDLVNSARADTPGLKFAKEALCPVATHGVSRVHVVN